MQDKISSDTQPSPKERLIKFPCADCPHNCNFESDDIKPQLSNASSQLTKNIKYQASRAAITSEENSTSDRAAEFLSSLTADLSRRETCIAEFLLTNKSAKLISRQLNISPNTFSSHTKSIYTKLQITRRADLMTMYMQFLIRSLASKD